MKQRKKVGSARQFAEKAAEKMIELLKKGVAPISANLSSAS